MIVDLAALTYRQFISYCYSLDWRVNHPDPYLKHNILSHSGVIKFINIFIIEYIFVLYYNLKLEYLLRNCKGLEIKSNINHKLLLPRMLEGGESVYGSRQCLL